MKKLLLTTILTLLVASLAFNGVQFNASAQQDAAITLMKDENQSQADELAVLQSRLDETEILLQNALLAIEENSNTITTLQSDYRILQSSSAAAQSKVNGLMCKNRIAPETIQNLSTNQSLIEPITAVMEKNYNFNSVSASFELVWDDNKSAIFSVTNQKNEIARSIVTWGQTSNNVEAVYDIALACFYYIG